jgi:hypothetical protein
MNTPAYRYTTARVSFSLVSLVFGIAIAGCSSNSAPAPRPSAVTETIGPAGGTILVDGATVTFPPNAVAAPTSITITETDEAPPPGYVALSRVYRCGPSGTTFAQKVTMAMSFRGDATGARIFWSSGIDPTFKDVGGVAEGTVMTTQIEHFSSGFVGRPQ